MLVAKDATQRKLLLEQQGSQSQDLRMVQGSVAMALPVWAVDELRCRGESGGLGLELPNLFFVFIGRTILSPSRDFTRLLKRVRVDGQKCSTNVVVEACNQVPAERVDGGDLGEVVRAKSARDHECCVLRVRDDANRLST